MLKKLIFSLLLTAAFSHAAVKELIPNLTSADLEIQTQARLDLLAVCSEAGNPAAETGARKSICLEICDVLEGDHPVVSVIQPMLNNLERIGGEESVPTLSSLLNHKDEHIRDDARRALAVNPSDAAGQALGMQLNNRKARSAKETAGLIYALGERNQTGASKLIYGYLGSADQEVFIAAVKTLGLLNEDVGVKALFKRLAKEQGFRRVLIEDALLLTHRKAVLEKFYAESGSSQRRSAALLGLLLQGELKLAGPAMTSGDAGLQVAVIEAAEQSQQASLYDVVAQSVGTLPPHLQLQALVVLGHSGDRGYAKVVEPLLESPDWFIQDNAARALARIGTAESVAPLMANGRGDARRALGILNVDGVDAELEKFAGPTAEGDARACAIEALAFRGRQDLIPVFLTYIGGNDKAAATAAAKAVGAIGGIAQVEPLTDEMIEKEVSPVSRDILNAIVDIMRRSTTPGKGIEVLVSRVANASPRSQANILQALAKSGSKEAVVPLVAACKSNDEKLQKLAVKLLGGWSDVNGIPAMLELASEESMSLANHVVLMRGVSRLYAGEKTKYLNKDDLQKAIDVCRRQEEKDALQSTMNKLK